MALARKVLAEVGPAYPPIGEARLIDGLAAQLPNLALEATGNASSVAVLLEPYVVRVVICNPVTTRAIAQAKVKTDKVDARIPAQVLSADFLPGT